jgi:hypothetical protein
MPTVADQLRQMLAPYGLSELADAAVSQFLDGVVSGPELELWLEAQPVVQQRFSAVFERRKQGLPPISILDVVEYERRARELSSMYGLPDGFIDVNRLLVNDVSISELGERVQGAADVIEARPDVVEQLQTMYNLSAGDAIAYALDPDTGLPAVQRRFAAARVGAQAQRQGFGQLTSTEAEGLYGSGVDESQAREGFATLGRLGQVTGRLADEAVDAMDRDAQLGVVSGDQAALTELQRRQGRRVATFEETSGAQVGGEGVLGAGRAR